MMYPPLIFCTVCFTIMAVLLWKLHKIVERKGHIMLTREQFVKKYKPDCNYYFDGYYNGCEIEFLNKIYDSFEEAMKPKTCELCAYCEPFNSVCFNDKSPLCTAFVNSEYGCIYWERKTTT